MADRLLKMQFVLISRSIEPGWKLRDKLPNGSAEAWAVCGTSLKNGMAAFRLSRDRQVGGRLFVRGSPFLKPSVMSAVCFWPRGSMVRGKGVVRGAWWQLRTGVQHDLCSFTYWSAVLNSPHTVILQAMPLPVYRTTSAVPYA